MSNNDTNSEAQDNGNCGKSKKPGCKRRGGRRLLLGILGIGALGVLAAGSAFAGGGSSECGFGSKMVPTAKAAFVAERIADRAGATDDQQDEIEEVLTDLFTEVTELKQEKEERERAEAELARARTRTAAAKSPAPLTRVAELLGSTRSRRSSARRRRRSTACSRATRGRSCASTTRRPAARAARARGCGCARARGLVNRIG